MTDPLSGAVVKAGTDAAVETGRGISALLVRALGPSADVLGTYYADRLKGRLYRNLQNVAAAAERKAAGRQGSVSPRLASRVLDDGVFCDDEVIADYYGGILAASRTPDGKNDSGVAWASTVSGLSAAQIRAHFLFYREWHLATAGGPPLALGMSTEPLRTYVEFSEAAIAIKGEVSSATDLSHSDMVPLIHALIGLKRAELITNLIWRLEEDPKHQDQFEGCPFPAAVRASPSLAGLELYAWAQGRGDITYANFHQLPAEAFDTDPPTPRLQTVVMPNLADARTRFEAVVNSRRT